MGEKKKKIFVWLTGQNPWHRWRVWGLMDTNESFIILRGEDINGRLVVMNVEIWNSSWMIAHNFSVENIIRVRYGKLGFEELVREYEIFALWNEKLSILGKCSKTVLSAHLLFVGINVKWEKWIFRCFLFFFFFLEIFSYFGEDKE